MNLFFNSHHTFSSRRDFVKNIENNIMINASTKQVSSIEYNIELSKIGNLNICFIPNNVNNKLCCDLKEKIYIEEERLTYDKNNKIQSYTFKLKSTSKDIGYAIISGNFHSNLSPKFMYKLIISLFNWELI